MPIRSRDGKIERWHRTLESTAIRVKNRGSLDEARLVVSEFVEYYNTVRLHSAIDYVTPMAKLQGLAPQICRERDRKLEEARERRRHRRAQTAAAA